MAEWHKLSVQDSIQMGLGRDGMARLGGERSGGAVRWR
jgi:hypothetical protein